MGLPQVANGDNDESIMASGTGVDVRKIVGVDVIKEMSVLERRNIVAILCQKIDPHSVRALC